MTILVMILIVAGIIGAANLLLWAGARLCAKRGHDPIKNDEHPGHVFCGRCHADIVK